MQQRVVRRLPQRLAVARRGLVAAARRLQRQRQVVARDGVSRVEPQRRLELGDGIGGAALLAPHDAEPDMRLHVCRHRAQRRLVVRRGLVEPVLLRVEQAEIEMAHREVGGEPQGLVVEGAGAGAIAARGQRLPEVDQRARIARLEPHRLAVMLQRFLTAPFGLEGRCQVHVRHAVLAGHRQRVREQRDAAAPVRELGSCRCRVRDEDREHRAGEGGDACPLAVGHQARHPPDRADGETDARDA